MGWANCGFDSKGRPIGYAHNATCDFPGCKTKIDRGLAFACGGMHGEDEFSCEGYFCQKHRRVVEIRWRDDPPKKSQVKELCEECIKILKEDPDTIVEE